MRSTKRRLRVEFEERRGAKSFATRKRAADNLADWVASAPFRLEYDVTVAAYVPIGTEPGSPALLDALIDRGVTVIVPVVPPGEPAALDWVRYDGAASLTRGRWGLLEPTGDRLGARAIEAAAVVFVPAYAVDKIGNRLGRGAGYYDRTLAAVSAEVIAVVYDDEIVESLPTDPHDVRVGWALTPDSGFRRIG
ncbi:5-formyltetrahydrofolate cyclo-ligase [Gordonia sp. PKS22-38]|uniref:5-formyltetrahydrofolate cyclo-ligase n=1 Tax=Gordonia prachuapensis TaxID=3115651 RepID=A0ABU7MVF2_9ACTN|nr:5-formyltetrahydrofolate cyclo-ligase [Gordonia sp. PKS22-38]